MFVVHNQTTGRFQGNGGFWHSDPNDPNVMVSDDRNATEARMRVQCSWWAKARNETVVVAELEPVTVLALKS